MAEQEPRTPVDPMAKARRESDLLLWVVVGIAVLIACLWLYGAFGEEHEKPEQVEPLAHARVCTLQAVSFSARALRPAAFRPHLR